MYWPASIDVRRCGPVGYAASVTLRDDGLNIDGSVRAYRGLPFEKGPWYGLTRRRAFRKAFLAAGAGARWDDATRREVAACA